jgi:amino acid permease
MPYDLPAQPETNDESNQSLVYQRAHDGDDEVQDDQGTPPGTANQTSLPENKLLSPLEAAVTLVKGNMGPGILNLPHAFCIAGYALGSGLFCFVAIQGIYSMSLLVHCKQILSQSSPGQSGGTTATLRASPKTFMAVAEAALGRAGGYMVEIFLFILQGGVCCVFLSLLTTNLRAAVPLLTAWESTATVTAVLLVTVSLLRFIKDLVWLNVAANGLMLLAIVTAVVASMIHAEEAHAQGNSLSAAHWTGKAIITFTSDLFFAFEGIGLVLPVENSYDHKNALHKFSRVLAQSMTFVALTFVATGSTVAIGFAGQVHTGSITAFLRQEYPDCLWYAINNGLVMLAVGMTFPLQLTPAAEVLDTWLSTINITHYDNIPHQTPEMPSRAEVCLEEMREGSAVPQIGATENFLPQNKESVGVPIITENDSTQRPVSIADTTLMAVAVPRERICSWFWHHYGWMVQRWAMVLLFATIVYVVDDLAILMSLFGSIGQTGLAATPCIVHLALQRSGVMPQAWWPQVILDVTVVTFCTIVMVVGCLQALDDIWRKSSDDGND